MKPAHANQFREYIIQGGLDAAFQTLDDHLKNEHYAEIKKIVESIPPQGIAVTISEEASIILDLLGITESSAGYGNVLIAMAVYSRYMEDERE